MGNAGSHQVEHVVLGLKHFRLALLGQVFDRKDGAIFVVEGDSVVCEQQHFLLRIMRLFTPNGHNLLGIGKEAAVVGEDVFERVTVVFD